MIEIDIEDTIAHVESETLGALVRVGYPGKIGKLIRPRLYCLSTASLGMKPDWRIATSLELFHVEQQTVLKLSPDSRSELHLLREAVRMAPDRAGAGLLLEAFASPFSGDKIPARYSGAAHGALMAAATELAYAGTRHENLSLAISAGLVGEAMYRLDVWIGKLPSGPDAEPEQGTLAEAAIRVAGERVDGLAGREAIELRRIVDAMVGVANR